MLSGALYKATPVHPALKESVTCTAFASEQELVWAGTASGGLFALQCPDLQNYSHAKAHRQPTLDAVAVGDGIVSASADWIRFQNTGSVPKLTVPASQVDADGFAALCLEPYSRGRILAAYSSSPSQVADAEAAAAGGIATIDLGTKKVVSKGEVLEAPCILRAPAARGLVAVGLTGGSVLLVDPRAKMAAQHSIAAHSAGLADVDVRGDMLATCGYGTRQGQIISDSCVKVYDLRSVPRMTSSFVFNSGPTLLRFHPKLSSTLLVGSARGVFTLADANGAAYSRYEQLEAQQDSIVSCDMSPSGEELVFGSAGGYLHLWALNAEPCVSQLSQPLEQVPRLASLPAITLTESDSFALAAVYPPEQGRLLSDVKPHERRWKLLPPRKVHPAVLQSLKQVDFVGHAQNPHFKRGLPKGEAARLAALFVNLRVEPRANDLNINSESSRQAEKRAAAGQSGLPDMYNQVNMRALHSSRFEDFDFGRHNPTRFAGLENEIANCYANALLQVLYFIPGMRRIMLEVPPDPADEFSLLDETALLFRMLLAGGPEACQATNLLRALRQNKGAAALGLLETHEQRSGENSDIEVETNKDKQLQRRVQSLQRFLMTRLKAELAQRAPAQLADQETSAPGAMDQTDAGGKGEEETPTALANGLEQLFAVVMHQKIQCLGRESASKVEESISYQVELKYLPASERPTQTAGQAQPLSFRPGELPKQAAKLPQWGPDQERPSFSALLASSLKADARMRAWYDASLGYQQVQQTRLPKALPKVLVLSCGLLDVTDLVWWQPHHNPLEKDGIRRQSTAWLPGAIEVASDPDNAEVRVREADSARDLASATDEAQEGTNGPRTRAVYELTALVAHIMGDAEEQERLRKKRERAEPGKAEGHIVAHIKVPGCYLKAGRGYQPDSAHIGSPGQSPLSFSNPRRPPPFRTSPLQPSQNPARPSAEQPTDAADSASTAGQLSGGPDQGDAAAEGKEQVDLEQGPHHASSNAASSTPAEPEAVAVAERAEHAAAAVAAEGLELDRSSEPAAMAAARSGSLAPGDAEDFRRRSMGSRPSEAPQPGRLSMDSRPDVSPSQAAAGVSQNRLQADLSTTAADISVPGLQPISVKRVLSASLNRPAAPQWLLFNDFSVSPAPPSEVTQLYGVQKVPCLLYYTQVASMDAASAAEAPAPAPVVSFDSFRSLCNTLPLQHSKVKLKKPTFTPLGPDESPKPGTLLAIDTEFVAHSPPDKVFKGGVEIETRPSRLGLGRVSVLRGEGPLTGEPCIDDYIRATEPIYDYMTKWSGLVPGDLDPNLSPHHLTTLKKAYLKLRYLVDVGCIFVGHGLKKDFRMLNILVPPAQVVDTVELFHFKRQRKLSLRFLASYLLGASIQKDTHDSIVDARTALQLFQVYEKLNAEGRFQEKLLEVYRWGKANGWDVAPSAESTRQGT
ncbi:g7957 [Coccomyxa viridis]|uniref:G7957 protein n=1 Tax=Coccomyxa viridis TaxID=1274662 RepID=A0ABP1G0B4_9CHLO